MARTVGEPERRARLARRHRPAVATRTDDVVELTDGLVALHSTDPVTVYLSAAARMRTPRLTALDEALYERRTLVRHHAMRRTLWVFGHDAARAAHHSCTLALLVVQRRLLLGMLDAAGIADPAAWLDRAAATIVELLLETGPLTAREIGARLPDVAVPVPVGSGAFATTQAAHSRVLLVLGFAGRVVRARPTGTWINGQYRWAASESWIPGGIAGSAGTITPDSGRAAAAELARRWLRAFGPGTRADLQWWAGWTVATTKQALADVDAVPVQLDGGPGFLLPDDLDEVSDPGPSTALLPGLDPSTMGWRHREFHLDPRHVPLLFDRNGNGGPTAWADGRIVGGWAQRRDGEIAMRILDDVGAEARAALHRQAEELSLLLGDVRFSVRFPAPLQAELGS
jgi:hypothetical protein